MEGYDILMLVLLVGSTLFGAYKGLTWQVASIASMLVSYGAAYQFRSTLAGWIHADPPWNVFASMLILYATSSVGIWSLCHRIRDLISRMRLKEFDRQMGAIFGFAKGVIFCSIVTLFAVTLLGDTERRTIVHSRSGHYIARVLHDATPIMPAEVKQVIGPYLDQLGVEVDAAMIAEDEGRLEMEREGAESPGGQEGFAARAPGGRALGAREPGGREELQPETRERGGRLFGPLTGGNDESAKEGSAGGNEPSSSRPVSERRIIDQFRRWTDRSSGSPSR